MILLLLVAIGIAIGAIFYLKNKGNNDEEENIASSTQYNWAIIGTVPKDVWGMCTFDKRLILGTATCGSYNTLQLYWTDPEQNNIHHWEDEGKGESICRLFDAGNNELFMQTEESGKSRIKCLNDNWQYEFSFPWALGHFTKGAKYVATSNYFKYALLYKRNGRQFDLVSELPDYTIIWEMAEFNGYLYCACSHSAYYKNPNCGSIWRYKNNWEKVSENIGLVTSIAEFKNKLYIGCNSNTRAVLSSSDGISWASELNLGKVNCSIKKLNDNRIYAITGDSDIGIVYVKQDNNWIKIYEDNRYGTPGIIDRNEKLYLACNKNGRSTILEGTPTN